MIASGRADIAYLGPTPFVQARAQAKLEILAGETEAGQAFCQSALVVRSDSPRKPPRRATKPNAACVPNCAWLPSARLPGRWRTS